MDQVAQVKRRRAAHWFWIFVQANALLHVGLAFVEWSWTPLLAWQHYDARTTPGLILTALMLPALLGATVAGVAWIWLEDDRDRQVVR